LIVLRRKMRSRPRLTNNDRWFFIQLYRWFPSILQVLTIIRPEMLVRWHRAGYWRWKSRPQGGRPQIDTELRVLIRRMSVENPLWGAPRIHGETSSPVSASTFMYLMRWPVFLLIWLKLIFSESEVAGYKATGQVTRERRKKPFQLARGAIGYSKRNRELRIQDDPGAFVPTIN
jgi:hypothetical protein